jgi:hypothetical protein
MKIDTSVMYLFEAHPHFEDIFDGDAYSHVVDQRGDVWHAITIDHVTDASLKTASHMAAILAEVDKRARMIDANNNVYSIVSDGVHNEYVWLGVIAEVTTEKSYTYIINNRAYIVH